MVRGLISIITPCFNTGKYVSHLLDDNITQMIPSVSLK